MNSPGGGALLAGLGATLAASAWRPPGPTGLRRVMRDRLCKMVSPRPLAGPESSIAGLSRAEPPSSASFSTAGALVALPATGEAVALEECALLDFALLDPLLVTRRTWALSPRALRPPPLLLRSGEGLGGRSDVLRSVVGGGGSTAG